MDEAGGPQGTTWTHRPVETVEDFSDAVLGAGLETVRLSREPVTGSLVFLEQDRLLCGTGRVRGRVGLKGPLSQDRVTLGIALWLSPGSRHWLEDVSTGSVGVFMPSDEHDALYVRDAFYATVTLPMARLEAEAALRGSVLDAATLGGSGFHRYKASNQVVAPLRRRFEELHEGAPPPPGLTRELLDVLIAHLARGPRRLVGRSDLRGRARIVARAREYVAAHLSEPMSIDEIAKAAYTSRRTLHRAFTTVLDETPHTYVRKLRLNRIRADLASPDEIACTVSLAAHRWGIHELGRLASWYRDLFGELPSETLAHRAAVGAT